MKARIAVALSALLAAVALAAATPRPAAADSASCTPTVPAAPPGAPAPGQPCWTDVNPYPFGFDGNPVNVNSPACQSWTSLHSGDPIVCYLSIDSMAFRAWNRGIAVTSPPPNSNLSTTPFGVWLYNGQRWFPDPTFPGQSVCRGDTALWAGKLDYWLVGQIGTGAGTTQNWPALCRFDGVNFSWEPISVPKAALASVPINPQTGTTEPGAIQAGACPAWNNCWFFGSYGVVLHWDGESLTYDPLGLGSSPWLTSDFNAAVAGTDPAGNPFALAIKGTSGGANADPAAALGQRTQSAPDGASPPQVYRSSGGPFAPLGFAPPTTALPGDPYQTDLVAVDFNSQGQGWVAGDPRGLRPSGSDNSRVPPATEPSPLMPLSSSDAALPCPAPPADSFTYSPQPAAPSIGYLWSSIAVLPSGDALAGGWNHGGRNGTIPVLAQVSCSDPPRVSVMGFGSGATNPTNDPFTPDDPAGWITAVAANAVNDAWAAATSTETGSVIVGNLTPAPPPRLYHMIDTGLPLAPAGDDNEPRPSVFQAEPTIFVIAPGVVIPPPPPPTVTTTTRKGKTKTVKVPPPIYAIQRPKLVKGPGGSLSLVIRFKVRAKVTVGVEALHGHAVVSSSGLRTFRAKTTGQLVLKLDPKRWPTSLKFVLPKKRGNK